MQIRFSTLQSAGMYELNRHLAAIVIILSWAELLVLVGVHPKLKHCNIYVTMLLKVCNKVVLTHHSCMAPGFQGRCM